MGPVECRAEQDRNGQAPNTHRGTVQLTPCVCVCVCAECVYMCVCAHLLRASESMGWGVACWVAMPTVTSGRKGLFSKMCTVTESKQWGEGEEGEGPAVRGERGRDQQ